MLRHMMFTALCMLAGSAVARAADDTPAPAEAKPVVAMEEPQPGDFWIYQVHDEISGTLKVVRKDLITEVTATDISIRMSAEGKEGEGLNVYDRSWNVKQAGPWKYQPHDGAGIRTPLKVGDSWNFSGDDINAGNGNIWKRTGRSKVVGQETITTKAGTFETYRIETISARRPTNDPTRKMDITLQTWYAPAIDHWVKRVLVSKGNNHLLANNTIELVEYGRKK